jgi:hypothetical protein
MATGREWKSEKWWIALPIATRTIDRYPLGPRGQRVGTSPGAAYARAWAEVGMTINGNVRNIYALAGTHDHVSTVPAAYQVAAPFGVNVGGVDPLFFQMSPTSQFDSWLTMGNGYNAGISTMGSVGINFDGWTETAPLTFDNGAIFLMNPDDATPARTAVSSSGTDVVLAHLTVATGTTWTMTIGKLQGRSLSGQDFQEVDLHFSNS